MKYDKDSSREHDSLDDVLKNIREIITSEESEEDDILELTDIILDTSKKSEEVEENSETENPYQVNFEDNFSILEEADEFKLEQEPSKEENQSTQKNSTIESLIRDILKPALNKWLEENLEDIVKKVVEEEVRKNLPNK